MPKQRTKAQPATREAQPNSDAEILLERRRVAAFDRADQFLLLLSWGLWLFACVWFAVFAPASPQVKSLHRGLGEPLPGLLVCGLQCGSLSRASPRGTWSTWRSLWHFGFGCALGLLAAAMAAAALAPPGAKTTLPARPNVVLGMAVAVGFSALGCFQTCPGGAPSAARPSSVVFARMLFAADGVAGFAVAGSMLLFGTWGAPLGPLAIAVSALPLVMTSLSTMLARTDNELVAVAPAALTLHVAATCREVLASNMLAAIPTAVAVLLHAALYLPLPLHEPDSNPFHWGLARFVSSSVRWFNAPVKGFGDED